MANRTIIGNLNNSYKLRISKAGVNVFDADPYYKNTVIDTDILGNLKVMESGFVVQPVTETKTVYLSRTYLKPPIIRTISYYTITNSYSEGILTEVYNNRFIIPAYSTWGSGNFEYTYYVLVI